MAVAAVVLALAAGGLAFGLYKFLAKKPAPFQSIRIEKLTDIGNATTAQISPDGQYVAHAVYEGGKHNLRVWHVSTKSSVEIVPPAEGFLAVRAFSPDSRYIYYTKSAVPGPGQGTLYQIAVLGGAPKKILERAGLSISFLPDGRRFAFMREGPGQGKNSLMIANTDGTGERALATRGGAERFGFDGPAWSPDGRYIVFESTRSGRRNIWRMDLDGGGLKQLTDGGRDTSPRFSPDGSWVIYASLATTELRKVPADGGESVRLADRHVLGAVVSPVDGSIAGLFRVDENSP